MSELHHESTVPLAKNTALQPFDWLTSAASLESILLPILGGALSNRVLHVGCGSSTLGELLLEDARYNVSTVVNVDCDTETLERMEQRWKNKRVQSRRATQEQRNQTMQFVTADFTLPDALRHFTDDSRNASKFDVVVDKSTLDCMLCSDTGAIGLLLETYRCLKENGGVYLVISFHPSDFIRPLLENLPGAHWDVECTSLPRQMEQLTNIERNTTSSSSSTVADMGNEGANASVTNVNTTYTWSSGTFQPDDRYVKYVTVITCRRQPRDSATSTSETSDELLDWDQVYDHVHRINSQWYQQTNPMLTKERVHTIEQAFASLTKEAGTEAMELLLEQCYPLLFTDDERENLSYDDFIGDWQSFLAKYSTNGEMHDQRSEQLPTDRMSFATAIAFLHVMQ